MTVCASLWLTGCEGDLETVTNTPPTVPAVPEPTLPDPPQPVDPVPPQPVDPVQNIPDDAFTVQLDNTSVSIVEGVGTVSVGLTVVRQAEQDSPITLIAQGLGSADELNMTWQLSDANLSASESTSNLLLSLAIGPKPILPQTRVFRITANDGVNPLLVTNFAIQVQPTTRPDIYLLVGQSNMVGFSENGSKQAGPGQADAPNERILQLNVTGNDGQNFAVAADFTNPENIFNAGLPLTVAVDPLHDGFDTTINGKAGELIGPALSFAKRALVDTTVDIYLVPAAWSDTGFCIRSTNRVEGIGWNATQKANTALSGTLLHDRAIARTNIALAETAGVLRGILWHQGEADSDNQACAETYADNLTELVASLRTNIDQDARGDIARGAGSDVPFIAATMSLGSDARGDQAPFSERKQLVDNAHRNIANVVPMSDFVNNDDLRPPTYACGEGSCVHFGSEANREMGSRYYETLISLLP